MKIWIRFGAMAGLIAGQLTAQGVSFDFRKIKHLQRVADGITLAYVTGCLSDEEKQAAYKRLCKLIMKEVK